MSIADCLTYEDILAKLKADLAEYHEIQQEVANKNNQLCDMISQISLAINAIEKITR